MDFSVLADRDCLVVFAAVVLCSDRGVEAHKMGYDYGGIAHLTAKGAAGRDGAEPGRVRAGPAAAGGSGPHHRQRRRRCLADQRGHLRREWRQRVTRTGARHRCGDGGRRD
jgi:hypothetical protein